MSVPKRYLVDTNILLRFLTGTPAGLAAAARKFLARAEAGEIVLDISPVVVAETYYTLLSFYSIERKGAAQKLSLLLQQRGIRLRDSTQILTALARLQSVNIGFADAFLAASAVADAVPVASFDRDFDKLPDVTRYEPKE